MRDWSLRPGDPLSLTLAADVRLCKPDYVNDHIWELEIGAGEPAALAIRTTYGLRARNMRLFYRFGELGKSLTNPADFHTPPRLRGFFPNFLVFGFAPVEGLEVTAEYWVPESHAIAGRLTMVNRTSFPRKITLELCGMLTPLDGQSLAPAQQQMVNVLTGQTSQLVPVAFMTGAPKPGPGPHPSLAIDLDFDPGTTRVATWALAAEASADASFESARQIAGRPWDAERSRIELTDARDVFDIQTGDADWDAALAFSQKSAFGLLYGASGQLPNPSFVQARQPDGGYSHKGDGRDYPPAWNGQSPLETYYLDTLLGAAIDLRRGLIQNFLHIQLEDGFIDNKPGLGGQRARFIAAPLLASLAWKYHQSTQDDAFLADAFPKLAAFFWRWFTPEQDQDRDGIPEWNHVLQTGFEDHPIFDVWHPWSQGVKAWALYNPELEAMLYREAASLILMAEKLDQSTMLGPLHEQAARLRSSVEASWDARSALYSYRDRITKKRLPGRLIAKHKGPGNIRPKLEFEEPVRLLIEVQAKSSGGDRPVVEISELAGRAGGDPEKIMDDQFQWRSGGLVATSRRVYSKIGRIGIKGIEAGDRLVVRTVNATVEDITLFTPLWARIPDHQHAQVMISRTLLDAERFDRPYGVPALAIPPEGQGEEIALSVHFPWNQLLGEGLLSYGFRNEAARLTVHLMSAAIQSLKQNRTFYAYYHAETGRGLGERGALTGLAPVGLFLQTLGVTVFAPTRIRLEGKNPFAWPVTIQYKGLKIVRGLDKTEVTFPNGKSAAVTDPSPLIISAS
jgi:mannosylglycerate hydrolase MGH1-like protein